MTNINAKLESKVKLLCLAALCRACTEGDLYNAGLQLSNCPLPLPAKEAYSREIHKVERELSERYPNYLVRTVLRGELGDKVFGKYFLN